MLSVFCFHATVGLCTEFSRQSSAHVDTLKYFFSAPGFGLPWPVRMLWVLDFGPQVIPPTSLHRLLTTENIAIRGHRK